jgi:hypothetical protein
VIHVRMKKRCSARSRSSAMLVPSHLLATCHARSEFLELGSACSAALQDARALRLHRAALAGSELRTEDTF